MRDFPVLLVEDDEDDVLFIRRAFRHAALANPVHVAEDGDEAVAYLSGAGEHADRARFPLPGLILLDLKLPRRGGLEVLAWLRAQPGIGRTPVVVLTSSRERVDVDRAFDLGANGYLVKPVQADGLNDMVRTLAAFWMGASELPSTAPPPAGVS
jgi:CheY-like chemotaxis protein